MNKLSGTGGRRRRRRRKRRREGCGGGAVRCGAVEGVHRGSVLAKWVAMPWHTMRWLCVVAVLESTLSEKRRGSVSRDA